MRGWWGLVREVGGGWCERLVGVAFCALAHRELIMAVRVSSSLSCKLGGSRGSKPNTKTSTCSGLCGVR